LRVPQLYKFCRYEIDITKFRVLSGRASSADVVIEVTAYDREFCGRSSFAEVRASPSECKRHKM